ncbi:FdhF/YdeP family oxidoreductase [Acinetobacter baumannii]|uniref:FdhF/YdeP family oxidoreductase n=1 Tax=Acinetobacter baumannii TaxID=470 RepID=UPI0002881B8D|nr:FdhF/YdeP family oxidoreductase [Acinetobacter baumannii]EKU7311302.1 FdhF/YdeP family oxidoreductase [Acinetobacter baumannii]EXG90998.1 molybdopterin dinucleotide binding domain protein [Acinetobacter baumannii 1062314]MBJ9417056.1 FdhF/YdeP family oxidoreductase [Acinetobacter baumannii]MDC5432677.1 FdhF/YdeP family oxidoreductase [Acinetobacter baumannii]TPS75277.1 FdhF/YdeP family oxidoreductase [Acinetobacter baumannii]
MDNSEEQKHIQENNGFARIEPYTHPAGGWGALLSVARNLKRQDILGKGSITLLNINQPTGFDCPGCAWPEKKDAHAFNFCENGAKAVAFEATSKTVTPEYFAGHTVSWLSEQSDFFLEDLGRLTDPVRYDAATDKYVPISWDDAFKLIAQHLHALDNPDQAAFYTSGRASNEAAFLYQLFVRSFGTNNFPDCSNMCHETTSVGLLDSIGLGKGTVTLEDFDLADAIFSFGHNPGTNHPRMLGTLREVSKRGGNIIAINPIKERGLERFQDPQAPLEMMTNGSTPISRYYFQPKIGGDYALMLGILKHLHEWDKKALASGKPSVFDRNFIAVNTVGFDEMIAEVERTEWADLYKHSGLSPEHLEKLAKLFLASERSIFCWGMGITQHRHGTANVHMLANLLLARGQIGRPGAGLCPVRGHSNVQGDRTMGINELPSPKLLDNIDRVFGIKSPRKNGYGVVETIKAMAEGDIKVFIGLGGNFAVATPDTAYTQEALRKCNLTVHVATKLNRSHLVCGKDALILPCLGRTEIDEQLHGPQAITVEDSMSNVHLSAGRNTPISKNILSEPDIVARMAEAVLPESQIKWKWYIESYDRIRDSIAEVFDEFHDFNLRVYKPGGFHLEHPANQHIWNTKSGKAQFLITPLEEVYADKENQYAAAYTSKVYTLMTTRSHDQYNTTLYGLDDRYRGVFGQRRVLFMNQADIDEAGFEANQWVDIESVFSDGVKRIVHSFRIVPYNIPRGSLAAYYPETNPLVALSSHDKYAKIPASKSVPVILHPGNAPEHFNLATAVDPEDANKKVSSL